MQAHGKSPVSLLEYFFRLGTHEARASILFEFVEYDRDSETHWIGYTGHGPTSSLPIPSRSTQFGALISTRGFPKVRLLHE
jgi:hypothetical protein